MIVKAKAKYIRISPTKVNGVMKLVRGKSVQYALDILPHINKKGSLFINKLVKSAVSNAANKGADVSDLKKVRISRLVANSGPTLARYRAAPFGMAAPIRKRTTHLEVELECKEASK